MDSPGLVLRHSSVLCFSSIWGIVARWYAAKSKPAAATNVETPKPRASVKSLYGDFMFLAFRRITFALSGRRRRSALERTVRFLSIERYRWILLMQRFHRTVASCYDQCCKGTRPQPSNYHGGQGEQQQRRPFQISLEGGRARHKR